VHLWNVEGKLISKYIYEGEKGKEPAYMQTNRLEFSKEHKLIIAGCEDSYVRFFDYSSGKIIKKLPTEGAVSSVLSWDEQILASDHKSSLYFWDLRTFSLIDTK
jgi:WD40 repeat protein